ncbi:MAG: hypothetical protein U0270_06965 [Labilithrix sp.]
MSTSFATITSSIPSSGLIDYRVVEVPEKVRHVSPAFLKAGLPGISVGVTLSTVPTTPIDVGYAHLVFTGE